MPFKIFHRTRYIILALSTVCLTLVISNSLALNFTVICMDSVDNGTVMPMFSLQQQGWLFSAVAIGQLLGTLPITLITTRLGVRVMFAAYGLLSSMATISIPPSLFLGGFPALMAMRICQGIGIASIWVVIGSISAQWSPLASSGIFLSVLSCNLQIGPVLAMPLAAELCSSERWGWPPVYYLLGTISLIAFLVFFVFFRDSPQEQNCVSAKELALIEQGKFLVNRQKYHGNIRIPYREILKDPVFWGLFTSTATGNMSFQIFWQYGPLYLNKALGMEVAKTGLAAALPFLLSAIVKVLAGQISDRIGFISEKGKVIMFASVSQYLMAGCFLTLAILPKLGVANVTVMQACFTGATVFSGLNAVGIVKSTQLVSRQLSHILFSWNTLILSLIMLILPLIISWLTPTNSVNEWSNVYFFITATVVAATTFFNFTAEVEPRPWVELIGGDNSLRSSGNEKIFTVEKTAKYNN